MVKSTLLRTVILLYLLLLLLLVGLGEYTYYRLGENDRSQIATDMVSTLQVTETALAGLIQRNQAVLTAFFSSQPQQLDKLASAFDEQEINQLTYRLHKILPSLFTMNLMQPDGSFALTDWNGKISEMCRTDTQLALRQEKYLHRLHPNNLGLHYDTYYPYAVNGSKFLVMASVRTTEIQQILSVADSDGFKLYIRSPLNDRLNILLGTAGLLDDKRRIRAEHTPLHAISIQGTDMALVAVADPAYLNAQHANRLKNILPIGTVAFVLLTIMWLFLLRITTRQIRQKKELRQLYAALEDSHSKLEDKSRVNQLTGLNNRGYFDSYFQEAWYTHTRRKACLSVILCDIDNFKRWNDSYGHAGGDQILRLIANVIKKQFKRHSDLAARYGGDELIILLTNTELETARQMAETLRASVEVLVLPAPLRGPVTVSLGVAAATPDPAHSPESLIRQADMLLYRAKKNGRNRVVS